MPALPISNIGLTDCHLKGYHTPMASPRRADSPPSTRRVQSPSATRRMTSPPCTPVHNSLRQSQVTTPPIRPCQNPLLSAMRSGREDLVEAALVEDDNLMHIPCHTAAGLELPLFIALKEDCSPGILKCLLKAGASVDDLDANDRSALEVVATLPKKLGGGLQKSMESVWTLNPGLFGDDTFPSLVPCFALPSFTSASGMVSVQAKADDEARRCACARLLLHYGGERAKNGTSLAIAVGLAEENQLTRLKALMQHWGDMRAALFLEKMRCRRGTCPRSALLDCPSDIWQMVQEALLPLELM